MGQKFAKAELKREIPTFDCQLWAKTKLKAQQEKFQNWIANYGPKKLEVPSKKEIPKLHSQLWTKYFSEAQKKRKIKNFSGNYGPNIFLKAQINSKTGLPTMDQKFLKAEVKEIPKTGLPTMAKKIEGRSKREIRKFDCQIWTKKIRRPK